MVEGNGAQFADLEEQPWIGNPKSLKCGSNVAGCQTLEKVVSMVPNFCKKNAILIGNRFFITCSMVEWTHSIVK